MDTAPSQPGSLILPLPSAQPPAGKPTGSDGSILEPISPVAGVAPAIVEEMFLAAEAEGCGLTLAEFGEVLSVVGAKCNFGQPSAVVPDPRQCAAFVRGLRLADLALAHACALGRESAWKRFLDLYRAPLTKAAIAITRSATLGEELADSLYAELYGLRQTAPEDAGGAGGRLRRSPLASYSGRGSLMGWLRTTLAQRHVDLHRRTRRETPLADFDAPAPQTAPAPLPAHLLYLKHALTQTIRSLSPEDRFLLSAYFLDQRTLLEIGRILHVHEATVSRRIKRLAADLREELLLNLRLGGMNMRAAEEVLGIDPRDLEINLHWLLQTSQASPFQEEAALQTEAKQAETGQS